MPLKKIHRVGFFHFLRLKKTKGRCFYTSPDFKTKSMKKINIYALVVWLIMMAFIGYVIVVDCDKLGWWNLLGVAIVGVLGYTSYVTIKNFDK